MYYSVLYGIRGILLYVFTLILVIITNAYIFEYLRPIHTLIYTCTLCTINTLPIEGGAQRQGGAGP